MANSASQPRSVVRARTVQSASQFVLNPCTCPRCDPALPDGPRYARRLALPHHLAVVLDAERIGAEDERVLPVVERVEEDLDRVGLVEFGVAAALADDNLVGLRVVADDADIQRAAVDQESDLGALGRGLAFVGFLLRERAEGLRERPGVLVDAPVDLGTLAVGQAADRELGDVLGCGNPPEDHHEDHHEGRPSRRNNPGRAF